MSDLTGKSGTTCPAAGPGVVRENWCWFVALGLAMIVFGALAITLPGLAGLGVTLLLGWLLVVAGAVQGVHAFGAGRWSGRVVQTLVAALYVLMGALVLTHPLAGMVTLTVLLAAFLLVEGFFRILLALQLRPTTNWSWVALSGAISVALGAMIWGGLPGDVMWAVGLLVGVNMVFNGSATLMLAWAARDAARATTPGNHGQMPSHA
ncbi:MAG: HdeD family acid-resistance protein [Pirellulales bacterium]|nr:HdeD family acid-resistance protein [Pirellulales bacterium]